jgi:hypothetical protein
MKGSDPFIRHRTASPLRFLRRDCPSPFSCAGTVPSGPRRIPHNCGVSAEPADSDLLRPCDVAAWLDVDEAWLARAVAREGLPVMGWTSDGQPIVAAAEVRTWLRRPDSYGDTT